MGLTNPKKILVTGGAGFIGSAFIRMLFSSDDFYGSVVNLDVLTYAGNPENLSNVSTSYADRYRLIEGDIRTLETVQRVFEEESPDIVVHFAAESHVDRSIDGPEDFITTNIMGTFRLLEAAGEFWKNRQDVRFHHVSTDEVYGSLGPEGLFREDTPYDPRSPYSASKASSDHLVRAFAHTYGLPITISNCSNNYGPYQFPEKLIPVVIENALAGKPLPIYGDGMNIRDWLHVDDHAEAIWTILNKGRDGETYNVGGNSESTNIDLVRLICTNLAELTNRSETEFTDLITYVSDRPGHDRRYAIDAGKIKTELGWEPQRSLNEGIRDTVAWYLENRTWVDRVKSGEYRNWMERNYENR